MTRSHQHPAAPQVTGFSYALAILLLSMVFFLISNVSEAQCSGCTITVSTSSSSNYTVSSGQKLCITSSGTVTGNVTINGGSVCNQGTFSPGTFSFSSGTFDNYASATFGLVSLSGSNTTFTSHSGATTTFNSYYNQSNAGVTFVNSGTMSVSSYISSSAGSFTNNGTITNVGSYLTSSGGTFTNNGSITTGSYITFSGSTSTNNGTLTSGNGFNVTGGSFTNSSSGTIANTGNFSNSGTATTNSGTITNTGNFSNSGTFTHSAGSISCVNYTNNSTFNLTGGDVTCTNMTNSGTLSGPSAGAGCGVISVSTSSNNSGTINNYADICDATPPSGSVKIDVNSGTVASTVTYCTCCVLNNVTITGTTTICNGAGTTLTASAGGTTYSWSTSATTQAITVSPGVTTAYTVTVTYANSCTKTSNVTVTVNPKPTANAGSNATVCSGTSNTIGGSPTASGGTSPYTYSWSPSTAISSATAANPSASPTANITYTVTVTDANGCSNTSSVAITVINPSALLPTPLSAGDYAWTGNVSTDFSVAGNWLVYSGSSFSVASTKPVSTTNVFIRNAGTCIVNMPHVQTNKESAKNVTIDTATTLTINSSDTLQVYGNFTDNGTFTPNSGTVIMRGSVAQTISGTVKHISFYNLTANNATAPLSSASIFIADTVKVTNQFKLTRGYVVTTGYVFIMTAGSSVTGNPADSAFVSGPMIKYGNTQFTFPVGKSANYQPLKISAPAYATDGLRAEYFKSAETFGTFSDTAVTGLSCSEYWILNRSSDSTGVANVTLGWNSHSCNVTSNISLMRIAEYDSVHNVWKGRGGHSSTGTSASGTITSDTLTIYGPLTLGSKFNIPGSTPSNPILLGTHDSITSHTLYADAQWFKFTADSARKIITINNQQTADSNYIYNLSLYKGSPASLQLIASSSRQNKKDTVLVIDNWTLGTGQNYYIEVKHTIIPPIDPITPDPVNPDPSEPVAIPGTFPKPDTTILIIPPSAVGYGISIGNYRTPAIACENCIGSFRPEAGKTYIISGWVKESGASPNKTSYTFPKITVKFPSVSDSVTFGTSGAIIDGWQRVEGQFKVPSSATNIDVKLKCSSGNCFFDDIRVFPYDGTMKTYVYDPVTLRLAAELDERNYATVYEYDEEGKLTRVKKETERGIMTIKESKTSSPKKQ